MFFAAFLKNNLRNKTDIMMRVLALDIGDKRIGVAVSDPLGITALSAFIFALTIS